MWNYYVAAHTWTALPTWVRTMPKLFIFKHIPLYFRRDLVGKLRYKWEQLNKAPEWLSANNFFSLAFSIKANISN